ncbi:HAMP domain-containing protein [Cohnella hashimotonis]|uniref:Adenylate/guanylate cyclase domain-containing protein n=1 Tax=Cohnella hashimotonis TaxID=2826895 RepID=A0ABT6TFS4_9BACL|nr:adenylate/guanylate cyclase domain-containing protein [Cohnella hashimotonis]MDI4645682.1 adenylate/guanylate cyclase domain-containing protein [Cohnella hashimotonis]
MKKLAVLLLLASLIMSGWSGFVLVERADRSEAPWKSSESLQNLSLAAPGDGSLAVVSDSKQKIKQLDVDGTLLGQMTYAGAERGARADFNEAVADEDGRIYALVTVLDSYGLYVQSERIVRYDRSGNSGHVLYERKGDGKSKRIGHIEGLQLTGGSLYFYEADADKLQLRRIVLPEKAPETVFAFTLPKDRYLSEITGTEPGQIYYTTRRGSIYQVSPEGVSTKLYPDNTRAADAKNFPELVMLRKDGSLMFVDRLVNAVTTFEPLAPAQTKTVLDDAALQRIAPGLDSYEIMDIKQTSAGYAIVLNDRILLMSADFAPAGQISKVGFDSKTLWDRRLLWGAFWLGLLLLVFSVRFFHIHVLDRRTSLFLKQVLATVPAILIAMILLSNFIYNSFSTRMESQMQRELALLARNGQNLIDGDRLARLHSPTDYRNEDYTAIRAKMNFLFEGEDSEQRQGLYSTLYKYEGDRIYIVMDDDDGVNMFKPFEKNEVNEAVLSQGVVRTGQWEDAEGKWLYAIGPVYDSAGRIVGVYETGRDLSVLHRENRKIYYNIIENILMITAGLVVLVVIVTFVLLSPIRKLRRSVMAMANGDWDTEVKLRNRDEVGDLGVQFNRMARYIRQHIADITSFSEASYRFVPQQFFNSLGKKGILDIRLGDQIQKNMAVMVANLREFRQLSKTLSPKENFDFMNSFLRRFGPIVRQEDGLISKYLGAGFMALFPGYAEEAIRAAVAIRRELLVYNQHRRSSGYATVDIGIAIHKGPLMLGIIGEERRWEGNVISDDVQRTTMLEQISEIVGCCIVVTRDYYEQLRSPERFMHRSLGRIRLESSDEAMELIDVYEGDPEQQRAAKERTKALFERGLALCQAGRFYDARETFVEVIKQNRMDRAAKLYFYLCDEYYQKGAGAGWNGTLAV